MKIKKFDKNKETNNKKKKSVGDRILNVALATSFAFLGFSVTRNIIISNKQYLKPQSAIERDAELFGADLDVMQFFLNKKQLVRLRHNEDEPIYVTIDSNIKNETLKKNINKSLEYVENIFSDINDKYKFQIVNESTANNYKEHSKTVIEYKTSKNLDDITYAKNISYQNKNSLNELLGDGQYKFYNINSVITVNENYLNQGLTEDNLLYVLVHELLHSFGLGDVYTGTYDRLTVMDVNYGFFSQIISPNDLRSLYSAYCENHIKSNGNIDSERVKEIQNKLSLYEEEYFKFINKKIMTYTNSTNYQNFDTLNGYFSFVINKKTYSFDIKDKQVNLKIYDKNNNLEKSCTGDALYYGNSVTIKGFYDKTNTSNLKLYFTLFKISDTNLKIVKIDNKSTTNISFLPRFNIPEPEMTR